MTAGPPHVSFIVPAWNAAVTIGETLASLQAQTFADWEAVIVDDGSRDATARIVRKAARRDPRLRLVRQRNAGASAARNTGIGAAQGRCIAFLDSDDWIDPDFLETLLPLTQGDTAIAYCAYRRILPSGRPGPVDWCPELARDAFAVLVQRCEPAIHCLVIPRALLLSVGGFDTTLRTCEDWDLWLRLARTGTRFVGTQRPLAHYRMRAASLSTSKVGEDARHVIARAVRADPRVSAPAPALAHGWRGAPEVRLAAALRTALDALRQGTRPPKGWLERGMGSEWRAMVLADPGQFIAEASALLADFALTERERTLDALVTATGADDPWLGAVLGDQRDLAAVRSASAIHAARRGRWLAMPLRIDDLPEWIDPPPGCDALSLRLVDEPLAGREIVLPLAETLFRAGIASAILEQVSLAELARALRVWRRPGFVRALIHAGLDHGHLRPWRRDRLGGVVRKALARHLGAGVAACAPAPAWSGQRDLPILLFDRLTLHDAPLLSSWIGQAQVLSLLDLLIHEGYRACGLADLAQARRGRLALPAGALAVVFADASSLYRSGLLARLPAGFDAVDVLFTPEEIAAALPQRLKASAPHLRIGAGLRMRAMPLGTAQALDMVRGLRRVLAGQNGKVPGTVAALCDQDGLPDAVLAAAGYDLVLSEGGAAARVDLTGPVVPYIACSGAEAIGDAIESLRPAA